MEDFDYKKYFDDYCTNSNLNCKLSFEMPDGFEDAFGMYDSCTNTVHINKDFMKDDSDYKKAFCLFHELRHAEQHSHKEAFSKLIVRALNYDICYNGLCSKFIDNEWEGQFFDGSEEYFTRLYLSQPHELDANEFAYQRTKEIFGNSIELEKMHKFWVPTDIASSQELEKMYNLIDKTFEK